MAKEKETNEDKISRHRKRFEEVVNTFDWLITAFILAFVFRAFVMEAFRIPTGSMADTLMGAHFRLACPQCGYHYEYGFIPERYRLQRDTVPLSPQKPMRTRCPSCGNEQWGGEARKVSNGDRILVLKCLYQFFEPKRWDVVVFKNPTEPRINYIKRLVGKPGETVEIIDGDIYINGQIERKPTRVQNELWTTVYDNDYQPVRPSDGSFNGRSWQQPFNMAGSLWKNDEVGKTIFHLDSEPGDENTIVYDTTAGNNFRAGYAYNDFQTQSGLPFCSDLRVRLYATLSKEGGHIGIAISKYESKYRASVDFAGKMVISKIFEGRESVLASGQIGGLPVDKPIYISFANVDHHLIFEAGSEKLIFDIGRKSDSAGERKTDIEPKVEIFGSGKMTLLHVAVFRDIHYTGSRFGNGVIDGRAAEGNPLKLKDDQFFVLGDNSPNSEDGRWWDSEGIGNNGLRYEAGIVPRDYLVGKAVFVYWPSGFQCELGRFKSIFAIIPDIGQMRFIYGGKE
jgi:signal peptidase I